MQKSLSSADICLVIGYKYKDDGKVGVEKNIHEGDFAINK